MISRYYKYHSQTDCNTSKQQHLLLAEEKYDTPSNKNNEKQEL